MLAVRPWSSTLFDAFLPLLILERFIPPLIVRVRRLEFATIGAIVFIDDNNVLIKVVKNYLSNNGTNRVIIH